MPTWAQEAFGRADVARAETRGRRKLGDRRASEVEALWVDFDRTRVDIDHREKRERAAERAREAARVAHEHGIAAARRRALAAERDARRVIFEIEMRAWRELSQRFRQETDDERRRERRLRPQAGHHTPAEPSPSRRLPAQRKVRKTHGSPRNEAEAMESLLVALERRPESSKTAAVDVVDGASPTYIVPPKAGPEATTAEERAAHSFRVGTCDIGDAAPSTAILLLVPDGPVVDRTFFPRATASSQRSDQTGHGAVARRATESTANAVAARRLAALTLQRCGRAFRSRRVIHGLVPDDRGNTSPKPSHRADQSRMLVTSQWSSQTKRSAQARGPHDVATSLVMLPYSRDFSIPTPTRLRTPQPVVGSPGRSLRKAAIEADVSAIVEDESVMQTFKRACEHSEEGPGRPSSALAVIQDRDLQVALSTTTQQRRLAGPKKRQPADADDVVDTAAADAASFFALGSGLGALEPDVKEFVRSVMRMTPAERSYQRQKRHALMQQRQRAIDTEVFDRVNALATAEAEVSKAKQRRTVDAALRLNRHKTDRARRELQIARDKATAKTAQERASFVEREALAQVGVERHVRLREEFLGEDREVALANTSARVPGADKHMAIVQRSLSKHDQQQGVSKGAKRAAPDASTWRMPQKRTDALKIAIDHAEGQKLQSSTSVQPSKGARSNVSLPDA